MLRENNLTTHLVKTLLQGKISGLVSNKKKNIELRREVGDNSFFADILISLLPRDKQDNIFDNKKIQFIAIEVKVSDWKQGLYQAWRYYSFAEKSYLALYKDYAKNIDIEMFKKYNVGLIIFDEKTIKIVNKPKVNKTLKNSYELKLREKIWRRSLAINSIQPAI
jgi:hypothetical protein